MRTHTFRVATPLDGTLRVGVQSAGAAKVAITADLKTMRGAKSAGATVCGTRSATVTVTAPRAYTLTVLRP